MSSSETPSVLSSVRAAMSRSLTAAVISRSVETRCGVARLDRFLEIA